MFFTEPGVTNYSIYLKLRNATTGLAKTGLVYNSAGASCTYVRPLAIASTITLATLAGPSAVHADGGFVEVNNTTAKGLYRLDLPDAAVATGAKFVIINIEFDGVVEESVIVWLGIPVDVQMIDGSAAMAALQQELLNSGISGTVAASPTSTPTKIESDLIGIEDNSLQGMTIYFRDDSSMYPEKAKVSANNGSTGQITVYAMTKAPAVVPEL